MPGRIASLALALALAVAPAAAQESVEELARRIEQERDQVDLGVFARLAAHGDAASFDALERALDRLSVPRARNAAYGAFAAYREHAELGPRAVALLANEAKRERNDLTRRGATTALTRLGDGARDALLEVVDGHRDEECRAIACDALVPYLARRGDLLSVERILDHASLRWRRGGPYVGIPAELRAELEAELHPDVVARVLKPLAAPAIEALLLERVVAKRVPAAWQLVLLEAIRDRPGDAVTSTLLELAGAVDPRVVLETLVALDPRVAWADHDDTLRPLLKDREPAVRRAAVPRLGEFGINEAEWREEVLELAEDRDAATRMGAAIALGHLRTPEAIEALHGLVQDDAWSVRVEALRVVGEIRRAESLPLLVERLELESGRMREDVAAALRKLTGLDLGDGPARWRSWWDAEGATYALPSPEEIAALEAERRAREAQFDSRAGFYGIPVTSERVAFLLDVSGSMIERAEPRPGRSSARPGGDTTRLDVAKEELELAVKELPEDCFFNLLFFETAVHAFSEELVRLERSVRPRAIRYVRDAWAQGATAVYPALEMAFADPVVDTIYVLSDGHPTEGEVTDPDEILARVRVWNAARHVRIHGVSVGRESPLLRGLAEETGGRYLRVD